MQIARQVYMIPTAENGLVFFKNGEAAYIPNASLVVGAKHELSEILHLTTVTTFRLDLFAPVTLTPAERVGLMYPVFSQHQSVDESILRTASTSLRDRNSSAGCSCGAGRRVPAASLRIILKSSSLTVTLTFAPDSNNSRKLHRIFKVKHGFVRSVQSEPGQIKRAIFSENKNTRYLLEISRKYLSRVIVSCYARPCIGEYPLCWGW